MTRHLIQTACLLLAAASAQAGEAGRIVFVVGQANIANHSVKQGDAVHEGDEINTGVDGYVYLKTLDNGFLILRPASRARIVTYHVDRLDPKNTRIKLELLSGVARSISGDAVKQARQNFRFNTPVAAIGVRGTDFTVFTDAESSRVAVISGGIVVAGFAGSCGPEGTGPCEGNASRELFANQVGQMLQVRRGQAAPQLLPAGNNAPDANSPARPDEPVSKPAVAVLASNDLSLDPQKNANLQRQQANQAAEKPPVVTPPLIEVKPPVQEPDPVLPTPTPTPTPTPMPTPTPTPIPTPTPTPTPAPVFKEITWGRWQKVLDKDVSADLKKLVSTADHVAMNNYFALYVARTGSSWTVQERGNIGFTLKQSEAYVLDQTTRDVTTASLSNGQLQIDFDKKTFETSFDLLSGAQTFKMRALGEVGKDGRIYGENSYRAPTNMDVNGIIGPDSSVYYLFQGRLDAKRLASGATVWGK